MADTKDIIKCPACNNKMKKIYIPEAGVNVDICTEGCGGIYFDNRELEKFDEKEEDAGVILSQIKDKEYISVDESKIRVCPACGAKMVKFGAAGGEIEIDVCYTCGGKFLDHGEIQKIRAYENNNQKIDAVMSHLFESVYDDYIGQTKPSPRRQFFENIVKNFL